MRRFDLPPMAAPEPTRMLCRSWPNVGGGLPPMAASEPTRILCRSWAKCGRGLAPDDGLRADQDAGSDRVHIRFCGNGCLGFRFYSGSLLKSAKVSKTLLPHHSAPRLGSVCPNAGLNPWAAATRHPWRGAANPASCRVAHGFKPAFGQRGLTGRLRSRSKAARFASWLRLGLQSWVDTSGN
ncbi:Threonine synthase [Pseudomonas orientalis]|nr:Threonine synthase [Pseudomonas orientalis]